MTVKKASRTDKIAGRPVRGLTASQYRFMLVLQARIAADGASPSFEELRRELGLKSKSSVSRLVDDCIQRGRIVRLPHHARSLSIVAPVDPDAESPARGSSLIEAFSDKELLREVSRRGLLDISVK